MPRGVALDELTNDNPAVVPDDAAHLETQWTFIQADPLIKFKSSGKSAPSRGRTRNAAPMGKDTRAVIRRYELYDYAGLYDGVFHQAVCAVSNCSAPADGEVGALISAQMTAANVSVPSITVIKVGSGSVSSSDKRISCGAVCTAGYATGDVATLTATPTSGAAFTGWSGACSGTSKICSIVVTDHFTVSAAFAAAPVTAPAAPTPTATAPGATTPTATTPTATPPAAPTTNTTSVRVSVGIGNKGRVVSAAAGIDCPNNSCSGKAAAGSVVTLTASATVAPFVSWSGACAGTQPTCTLTLTRDAQVQATFGR
jgi:hypothetical protein